MAKRYKRSWHLDYLGPAKQVMEPRLQPLLVHQDSGECFGGMVFGFVLICFAIQEPTNIV